MIVVDSSVWINLLRDRPSVAVEKLNGIEEADEILMGDFVLVEILQGARSEEQAQKLQRRFQRFASAVMLGPDIAVKAARNYRLLRSRGVTLRKWADLVIGTFAIELGHDLLHEDRDYDHMERHLGLKVL